MEYFLEPLTIGQFSIAVFIAIVFLQSGIDKVIDWKGNLSWLKGHFAKSPLAGTVTPMLAVVAIAEIATGLMALCGIYCIVACKDATCIKYAIGIAKDYDGAKTIVVYFGVLLISLLLFN